MAVYEYRCERDGAFELARPLGTAPGSADCPVCTAPARRVFTSPMLRSSIPRAVVAAVDQAEKSRTEPEVVTSLPPRRTRTPMAPLTPTLRKLPRP